MPLFYQKQINDYTQLAVWEIMEPEEFFLKKVTLKKEITHPHKRLQHLAGRYLLKFLAPHFPLHQLTISDSRKPVLADNSFHFSISHCGDFAAAIVSTKSYVGIDVELINPKIKKLENKFLEKNELNLIEEYFSEEQDLKALTLFWSCKEAMFKWYGKGGVDFKKDMVIEGLKENYDLEVLDYESVKETYEEFEYIQDENNLKLSILFILIDDLPKRMKEIFILKHRRNLSYSEISEHLEISLNTVKTQLKRAKIILQSQIPFFILLIYLNI